MRHNVLMESKKSFFIKTIFFLVLLTAIALMYNQSKMLIDAFYFVVVFVSFMRFLFIKLY